MNDYTTIRVPNKVAGLLANLINILAIRYERERELVKFIYSKGHTQQELANFLGVTKAAVSLQYPKEAKK